MSPPPSTADGASFHIIGDSPHGGRRIRLARSSLHITAAAVRWRASESSQVAQAGSTSPSAARHAPATAAQGPQPGDRQGQEQQPRHDVNPIIGQKSDSYGPRPGIRLAKKSRPRGNPNRYRQPPSMASSGDQRIRQQHQAVDRPTQLSAPPRSQAIGGDGRRAEQPDRLAAGTGPGSHRAGTAPAPRRTSTARIRRAPS